MELIHSNRRSAVIFSSVIISPSGDMVDPLESEIFQSARSSNFDGKHNIYCTLDKTLPKLKSFEDVLEFIEKSRIRKALTDTH
ncbi:hypothetical protein Hanom_Chr05g00412011 [Helianthus anomalus]